MFTMNLDKLSINEKEVMAYVQQQMIDLAPHLDPKSPVEVSLNKTKNGFEVELTADHMVGQIQTASAHKDLFLAIKNAKEGLLQYFVELEAEMDPTKRDEKINYISRNGNFYLH